MINNPSYPSWKKWSLYACIISITLFIAANLIVAAVWAYRITPYYCYFGLENIFFFAFIYFYLLWQLICFINWVIFTIKTLMKKEGDKHSGCLNCSVCLLFFDFCVGVTIYGLGTAPALNFPYKCGVMLKNMYLEKEYWEDEWLINKLPNYMEWKAKTVDTGKVCGVVARPFLAFEILKFIILIVYLSLKCINTKVAVENENSQNQNTNSPPQYPNYQYPPQTPYYQYPPQDPNYQYPPQTPYYRYPPQTPNYQYPPQASNYQLPPQNENNQNLPQNPDASASPLNNNSHLETNDTIDDTQPGTAEPL